MASGLTMIAFRKTLFRICKNKQRDMINDKFYGNVGGKRLKCGFWEQITLSKVYSKIIKR